MLTSSGETFWRVVDASFTRESVYCVLSEALCVTQTVCKFITKPKGSEKPLPLQP